MRKIGFVDITDDFETSKKFSMYVFREQAGRLEFERVFDNFSAADAGGISDFYISLPVSSLDFRALKIPFPETDKVKKVIPFELDNLLLDGSKDVIFDVIVTGPSDNGYNALVCYKKKEAINEILRRFSSLNIDPRVVTSIELGYALKKGTHGIISRLADSALASILTSDERINAAADELSRHTINLRTGAAAYTKDTEKFKKALKLTAILAACVALAINADIVLRTVKTKKETASLRAEIRGLYSGLFPNERRISDELYQLKAHLREMQDKSNALTGVNPLQFLEYLSGTMPHGAVINEINLERDSAVMKGEAASIEDIDRMKAGLSGFLSDVSVSEIKPSVAGKQSFTIVSRGKR